MDEEELIREILFLIRWGKDVTMVKIVWQIRFIRPEVSEGEVSRMVWRLVDRGTLEFTKERRFVVKEP